MPGQCWDGKSERNMCWYWGTTFCSNNSIFVRRFSRYFMYLQAMRHSRVQLRVAVYVLCVGKAANDNPG
jgi:hypothetical protein